LVLSCEGVAFEPQCKCFYYDTKKIIADNNDQFENIDDISGIEKVIDLEINLRKFNQFQHKQNYRKYFNKERMQIIADI